MWEKGRLAIPSYPDWNLQMKMEKYMSVEESSLSITRPVKAWNKPLNANFREFFKGLTKAIVRGSLGEWVSAGCDLADAMAAVGLKATPGERAWLLIYCALVKATGSIVNEYAAMLRPQQVGNLDALYNHIDRSLEETKLTIDSSFFRAPKDLTILADYESVLKQWLEALGLNASQARSSAGRLGTYFVYAVRDEWQKHPQIYQPLRDVLDSPLTPAAEREEDWERYLAYIERQVDESMMGEPFGLRQVYIPLRAFYVKKHEEQQTDPHSKGPDERQTEQRVVVDLGEEISHWLEHGKRDNAIRVICGGPGSGKSSFAKMLAANVAAKREFRVVYIPLHLFDPMDNLSNAVGRYFEDSGLLNHNPLASDSAEPRILIVFDGLDELAMRGRKSQQVAHDFVLHLNTFVEVRNTQQVSLQVLLTGRTVIVQANQAQFRANKQVLHVLPYQIKKDYSVKYVAGEELLESDQRSKWWQAYGKASGFKCEGLPDTLARDDLTDLTSQPLLNYLVAISYGRKKVDFSDSVSLNRIYEDMLLAVYDRGYGGGPHMAIKAMEYEGFVRVLEEIGLAAWHGDGRTTTVGEIEKHCVGAGLHRLLDVFQEGAAAGVGRLLTAFYFRQHGQRRDGEKTFEFTHKSFGEYLTARRLVGGLRKIDREIERHRTDPDDGWDVQTALRHWLELTGPTAIDRYLNPFLMREIGMVSRDNVERWQSFLSDIISHLLLHSFPFDDSPRKSQQNEYIQARNAGESLLAALCACSIVTEKQSTIQWPEYTSAGAWIKQLQGQRSEAENVVALDCLARLSLKNQIFYGADLFHADMSRSDMASCKFSFAWLAQANLSGADLSGANLREANLREANLSHAHLSAADLREANLSEADLREANLREANLSHAHLSAANLREADLRGAIYNNYTTWSEGFNSQSRGAIQVGKKEGGNV